MFVLLFQDLRKSLSAFREYKILWLRHGLHIGRIQVATVRAAGL